LKEFISFKIQSGESELKCMEPECTEKIKFSLIQKLAPSALTLKYENIKYFYEASKITR
jgi:hypothetical protein